MKLKLIVAVFLPIIILLSSCTTHIDEYQKQAPLLDIQEYFSGKLIAWGMVQDYSARVTRRFCVELEGTWQGNKGLLAEKFYFDDGEISYRNWQLTKLANGAYTGMAEDVVGLATGLQSGFAFQWQYSLLVDIADNTYQFELDDWMYKVDQYRVFNKTTMKKLGVEVAEITLFFDKERENKTCS